MKTIRSIAGLTAVMLISGALNAQSATVLYNERVVELEQTLPKTLPE